MANALDWAHRHKKIISLILFGIAQACFQGGYHVAGDAILSIGTLTGFGWLPNGPNPITHSVQDPAAVAPLP